MVATKNKINSIIADSGLKKIYIAKKLGITRFSLTNKIKNTDTFTNKEVKKLLELFKLNYEDLF